MSTGVISYLTYIKAIGPYVCLFRPFLYLLPMAGRTAWPIKTKLGIGTHVDPGSVLVKVKVKVIYVRVRYKEFMPAHLANNHEPRAQQH